MASRPKRRRIEDRRLYTENELRIWDAIVRHSDFRSNMIPYRRMGIRDNQKPYPITSETPTGTFDSLASTEGQMTEEPNPMQKVTNCIVSLLVIGLKLLAFGASIGATLIQEGAAGVLAIWYFLWCQSKVNSQSIIRKGRRKRRTKDCSEDHLLNEINEEEKL